MAVITSPEQLRHKRYPLSTDGSDQRRAMSTAVQLLREAMTFDVSEDGQGDVTGNGPKGFQFYGSIALSGANDVEPPNRMSDVDVLLFNGPNTDPMIARAILASVQHIYGVRIGVNEVELADVKVGKRPDPFFVTHLRRGYDRHILPSSKTCIMPRWVGQREAAGIEAYYDPANLSFRKGSRFCEAFLAHKYRELFDSPIDTYAGIELGLNLPKMLGHKVVGLAALANNLTSEYVAETDELCFVNDVASRLSIAYSEGEYGRQRLPQRLISIATALGCGAVAGPTEQLQAIISEYGGVLEQAIADREATVDDRKIDMIVSGYSDWLEGRKGQVVSRGCELLMACRQVAEELECLVSLSGKDLACDDALAEYPDAWMTTDSGGTLEFVDKADWEKYVEQIRQRNLVVLSVDPVAGLYTIGE